MPAHRLILLFIPMPHFTEDTCHRGVGAIE
jgi:hypothetical protein